MSRYRSRASIAYHSWPWRRRRGLNVAAACIALLLLAAPAQALAHDGAAMQEEQVGAGPYTLTVRFFSTPQAGQELHLVVVPHSARNEAVTVQVRAQPGTGVSATPVRARMTPDADTMGGWGADLPVPVTGTWVLIFEVNGPQGAATGRLPIAVAAPGAIPLPVGWALGLTPLVGLLAFGIAQYRWLRARRLDELAPGPA